MKIFQETTRQYFDQNKKSDYKFRIVAEFENREEAERFTTLVEEWRDRNQRDENHINPF